MAYGRFRSADLALCVLSAWRWVARVGLDDALLVLADVSLSAVVVPGTFGLAAVDGVAVRDQARVAFANGVAWNRLLKFEI